MPISNKELLFSTLAQMHWDNFSRETLALIKRDNKPAPQVFISYAWPKLDIEQDIQAWLLTLHARLTHLGVRVLFDIKSMTLGTNIDDFMQQGVAHSDNILIIGTETYFKRSNEPTNVQREVEHIRQKVAARGTDCVIPILYRGEFWTALPALGSGGNNIQILGTDCHDELLYRKNLSFVIESLFQLQSNVGFQALKQSYLIKLQDIETHGLSDVAVADFALQRAQQERNVLSMQQENVNLMLELNAKGHPDYMARPAGMESPVVKLLSTLKEKYSRHTHIQALFGEPMALEEQYISVQMLYQVKEEKKQDNEKDKKDNDSTVSITCKDSRMTSFETIFSQKQPLEISQLFLPAQQLLKNNQKTNELEPAQPPHFILLQGRAGIGKTTFVNYVCRHWSLQRSWSEYEWVFALRLRDLRQQRFIQAHTRGETWTLSDWVYEIHFIGQLNKEDFNNIWKWLIAPKLQENVLFILDGYDEMPSTHPCQQVLTDLLNSKIHKILTSRPYGLSDLPANRRELEVVGFTDENVEKYILFYFGASQEEKVHGIISLLKANTSLWGNAHIPVTLNILCGTLEKSKNFALTLRDFNTMSKLYEAMEAALLERAYSQTQNASELNFLSRTRRVEIVCEYYQPWRQYLAALAYEGFSQQQLVITQEQVENCLLSCQVKPRDLSSTIHTLLALGLLKPILGEDATALDKIIGYEFLHLTFQEYYAACHILWQAMATRSENLVRDLAKIKLNPRYQIVLWFVAGALKDAKQFDFFLRALTHPLGSDMLGHYQLGLLLRCTEENWALAQQTGWVKLVTRQLQARMQALWQLWMWNKYHQEDFLPPVWVDLLKLSAQGYWMGKEEADLMVMGINDKNLFTRFYSWTGLATPNVMQRLIQLLSDENSQVDSRSAISTIGKLVDMLGFWQAFILMLAQKTSTMDKQSISWITLTEALTKLCAFGVRLPDEYWLRNCANVPDHLQYVIIDTDIDKHVNPTVPHKYKDLNRLEKSLICMEKASKTNRALEAQGFFPNDSVILAKVTQQLDSEDREIREEAIGQIIFLGARAATPEFLAALCSRLLIYNKNAEIQRDVIAVIQQLGEPAATPGILIALIRMVITQDYAGLQPVLSMLSKFTSFYLLRQTQITTNNDHFILLTALIYGAYLSGKTSYSVVWQANQNSYLWQGFADKDFYNIKLTLDQARWIRRYTPQIIQAINSGLCKEKLAKIHRNGLDALPNSANDPMLFEYNQHNNVSSSSSHSTLTAWSQTMMTSNHEMHGLSEDMIITFPENLSENIRCQIM